MMKRLIKTQIQSKAQSISTLPMYLSATLFVSALYIAFASAFASPLQNIYIGIKQADCGSSSVKGGQYNLWFSDSNVCNDG
jgi:hypothetical protein